MQRETVFKLVIVLSTAGVCGAIAWAGGLLSPDAGRAGSAHGEADAPPPAPTLDMTRARELGLPTDAPAPFDVIYANWPTEESVYDLIPSMVDHLRKEYHSLAISRPKPNQRFSIPWPEHPMGELLMVTNQMGFRDDDNTTFAFEGQRILVLGDSHTYGLVENGRMLTHVLEQRLQASDPTTAYNVINAGVSASGPLAHVGRFIAYRRLQPDLVVVVLFNGNDFNDAVLWAEFFTGGHHRLPIEKARHHRDVNKRWGTPLHQGFSQAYRFEHREGDDIKGLASAVGCMLELDRLCDEAGIPLLVAMLPSKYEVEPDDDPETCQALLADLELTDEDYLVGQRLGRTLLDQLGDHDIAVLDLAPSMLKRTSTHGPFFWRQDHHLNIAGHKFVAKRLEPVVQELLGDD